MRISLKGLSLFTALLTLNINLQARAETAKPVQCPENLVAPLSAKVNAAQVNIVIEGAGDVTERFYIPALAKVAEQHPHVHVTFCDVSQPNEAKVMAEKRARIRAKIEAAGFTYLDKSDAEGLKTYRALPADYVVFAVPGRFHETLMVEWRNRARAPKQIFLEKPIADSTEGARNLLDRLPAFFNGVLALDHYRPKLKLDAKQIAADLDFLGGQLTNFEFIMTEDRSGSDPTQGAVMAESKRDGAIERENRVSVMSEGVAADLLPHMFAVLEYFGASNSIRPLNVQAGRYRGVDGDPNKETEIPRETFFSADFVFRDYNQNSVKGLVVVGKGLKSSSFKKYTHETKVLRLVGINGHVIQFDLRSKGSGSASVYYLDDKGRELKKSEAIESNPYHALFAAMATDQVLEYNYAVNVEQAVAFREKLGHFTRGLKDNLPLYDGGMGGKLARPAPNFEDLQKSLPVISGPNKPIGDYDFLMIGFGVMGRGFAHRIAEVGKQKLVINDPFLETDKVVGEFDPQLNVRHFKALRDSVMALKRPRKMMLLVANDNAAKKVLNELLNILDPGDIVIDAGNTNWELTEENQKAFAAKGLAFIGMGVSGGERGARDGSSMMAGAEPDAWRQVEPILQTIAGRIGSLQDPKTILPTVVRVGPGGSGHFVKMAHNGIEYAEMELLAEAYDLLKSVGGMTTPQIRDVFEAWTKTELNTFLLSAAVNVLSFNDDDGQPLVDKIRAFVEQKGTGLWATENALRMSVFAPAFGNAVNARYVSKKYKQAALFQNLRGPKLPTTPNAQRLLKDLPRALYAARLMIYGEALAVIRAGSTLYFNNEINLGETLNVWRKGSILQGAMLDRLQISFDNLPGLEDLMTEPSVQDTLSTNQLSLRRIVQTGIRFGVPVSGLSTALTYFDTHRRIGSNPTNLLAAIRDYFGGHKFSRIDAPDDAPPIHSQWGK